jgi:hypothetical protein
MAMKKVFVTILVAIFATVVFGQTSTKVEIKIPEVPKCIVDWVKLNMKGYDMDKAYKVANKTDQVVKNLYYVRVVKGKDQQYLVSDADCRDVKKTTVTVFEKEPPKPMPPVKVSPDKAKDDQNEQKK